MPHSLLFFPDYRAANPYQELLYAHTAPELHARAGTIFDATQLRGMQPPGRGMVFHLHWEDAVYRHELDEAAARAAAQAFLDELERFLDGGGRFLWTIHNAGPHEERYPEVHAALRRALITLADLVHVHSRAGLLWAVDQLGLPPSRLVLAPHGNYAPLFRPGGGDPRQTRQRLGLPEAGDLLLLFGRLEPYKGASALMDALARTEPSVQVLLAGRQIQPLAPLLDELPPELRARIHLREGFIAQEEVPALFHAADAVVMPYRAILSSGTALLAQTLARPVIAPAFAGITDQVQDGVEGLLYDPMAPDGLSAAITRFTRLDEGQRADMASAAAERARLQDWAVSGNILGGAVHMLLARPRSMRLPSAQR